MRKKRIYTIFKGVEQRCNNPKQPAYKDYGGRGIKCEWNTFQEFYNDMKEGYSDKLSIDRTDNDGNYCKENCRWATPEQQANNSRHCRYLTHKGKTQSVSDWARELGVNYWTLIRRIHRGWSTERALQFKDA